jgi:16S rRNA (guanine527-N7)-methyltransferase
VEHHNISTHKVSRETFIQTDQLISKYRDQLNSYLDELLWWNKRINLVSRDVSRETVWEHIRHSLLLSQLKPFQEASIIVDAGTGGGLPGIPLAITHPKKHFVLNDLVTKKCLAMKQIAKKINLTNVGIIDGSIEKFSNDEPFLLISKHAFKVNELYQMTSPLPWSIMVFYKGLDFKDELDEIPETLDIESYDLSEESEFYQGKALVVVSRTKS